MDKTTDFVALQEQITSNLVKTTRTAAQISAEDLNFHRSSNAEVSEALDEQSSRLLGLTNSLLKVATAGSDLRAPRLQDQDGIEDNWRAVVDVIDELLEKADACLDEFTGVIKKLSPSQEERNQALTAKSASSSRFPSAYDFGSSKIAKPQLLFDRAPENTSSAPFKPLLRSKPHALVPLDESLGPVTENGELRGYKHPYEQEIKSVRYPSTAYTASPPEKFQPFESTTATFVDSREGVDAMLTELKSAKEIAVDLEHHDTHSYHGLVSLMQISTRDKDWIVDTLKPWREELQVLNEVFADPTILKIFHGSTMDIIWLQRDLGLYVVGLFDTFHAAVALNYPKKSLKFLLEKFANFQADKKYQMADWRVRPLPPGMFDYARSDTHYLLYIYDNVRNALLENSAPGFNLVDYVLEHSKEEALQRYERPVYDAASGQGSGGWYDYLARAPAMFSKEQFAVFKAVHRWRDQVARAEDEGVQFILAKHAIFKIAHAMPLDRNTLFTVAPVSKMVKERAAELLEVIKNAKIEGATGPELRDVFQLSKPAQAAAEVAQVEQGLLTPPDLLAEITAKATRAQSSQFWGPALQHQPSAPSAFSSVASTEALQLALPLPAGGLKVAEGREAVKKAQASETPVPQPTPPPPRDTNEIFTVKQMGGVRKRKSQPDSPVADEVDSEGETEADSAAEPNPAKKQRKERKKNKKPAAGDEITPFDYSAAESVLHTKPETDARGRPISGPRGKKAFDPYAKSLNAPKGLPRIRKETAGKAFTFRK